MEAKTILERGGEKIELCACKTQIAALGKEKG